jgi:putative spermidine/putrescine transport system substrate-binding protein
MRRLAIPFAAALLVLTACGNNSDTKSDSGNDSGNGGTPTAADCGTTIDEIAAAAKKEGQVDLIALPDTWANYKGVLDTFKSKYGIDAPVANPDASSADEVTAIETLRGQPDMPDSVDVGPAFTAEMIDKGYAEVYKPTTWDEIPDSLKDPEGHWIGSYYGVLALGTNTTLVKNAPQTWADLKKPEYKGMVTINGDPREAGAAFAAVMAASVANGGSFDDILPGIEYFGELKKLGNLQVIDVTPTALTSGDVPIAIDWTYNFPGIMPQLEEVGFDFSYTVPSDGVYGGFYAQSVVTENDHPCASRLWLEHIVGDDGALEYLKGGAVPARYAALLDAGKVDPEVAKNLPSADLISQIEFPTADQVAAAQAVLAEQWGPMVADK